MSASTATPRAVATLRTETLADGRAGAVAPIAGCLNGLALRLHLDQFESAVGRSDDDTFEHAGRRATTDGSSTHHEQATLAKRRPRLADARQAGQLRCRPRPGAMEILRRELVRASRLALPPSGGNPTEG